MSADAILSESLIQILQVPKSATNAHLLSCITIRDGQFAEIVLLVLLQS